MKHHDITKSPLEAIKQHLAEMATVVDTSLDKEISIVAVFHTREDAKPVLSELSQHLTELSVVHTVSVHKHIGRLSWRAL